MSVKGSYSDYFPVRWLKADDIPAKEDLILTVKDIEYEPVGEDQEMKLVVYFEEVDKQICLNKTNSDVLKQLFGEMPNAAIGKRVALYRDQAKYMGKVMLVVRIRLETLPQQAIAQVAGDVPLPPEQPDSFDSVPF